MYGIPTIFAAFSQRTFPRATPTNPIPTSATAITKLFERVITRSSRKRNHNAL